MKGTLLLAGDLSGYLEQKALIFVFSRIVDGFQGERGSIVRFHSDRGDMTTVEDISNPLPSVVDRYTKKAVTVHPA